METIQLWIQNQVTNWFTNATAWGAPGPWAQMVGAGLFVLTVLQMLPDEWAGGKLFSRKVAWTTYAADAVFVFTVLVFPSLTGAQLVGIIGVTVLALTGLALRHRWNRPAVVASAPTAAVVAPPTATPQPAPVTVPPTTPITVVPIP